MKDSGPGLILLCVILSGCDPYDGKPADAPERTQVVGRTKEGCTLYRYFPAEASPRPVYFAKCGGSTTTRQEVQSGKTTREENVTTREESK